MTNNYSTLWDFGDPGLSEQRFRYALATASPHEAVILQTQIARTYGIRGEFDQARQILASLEPQIQTAGLEAQVYYYLELGRTYSSATHPAETQTAEVREQARAAYLQAADLAQKGGLDSPAIDALHMMTFVDTAPAEQLEWNHKALALMQSSSQPDAKKWEASLHNNTGYALYQLGRYEDALAEFELALTAYQRRGDPQTIRIARWMIAWTMRALGRIHDALEIQLSLEEECDKAGEPDPYVFEELELLYRAHNHTERAEFYANRLRTLTQPH